ncbi:MAG: hypothetical protein L0I76_24935 [Pseudonocardia sp.]|nr:hypothetical protein [Pseudonocardia sp.]
MNDLERLAADTAHGAVTAKLRDPATQPTEFVMEQAYALPEAERGHFLLLVTAAAVSAHAGTVIGLAEHGIDLSGALSQAAELRRAADDREDKGETR